MRVRRGLVTITAVAALVAASGAAAQGAPAAPSPAAPTAPTSSAPDSGPVYTGDIIVRFDDGTAPSVSSAARDRALDAVGASRGADLAAVRTVGTDAALVTGADPTDAPAIAARLRARGDVAYAEPDQVLRPATADPLFARQWNLAPAPHGIGAQTAWATTTGTGAVVAVIDSGIVEHPDLAGQVLPGYDFISSAVRGRDGDGRDANPRDEGDWEGEGECGAGEPALGSTWHGTHVAGTIAALADNGIGVAGVAPGAKILPARVTGRCGGVVSDVVDAITWASGGTVRGVPPTATPARVLNLSLGGTGTCSAAMQSAIDAATVRGAVVVTAAGNEGAAAYQSTPGNCDNVIDVAASTATGARASYSNYGNPVTVAAPGGDGAGVIYSTVDTGLMTPHSAGYTGMIGTSMAAPHVSGVAALVLAASPTLTAPQVRSILRSSARPVAACSGCGAGIVDAARAVVTVAPPTATPSPTASPSPTSTPMPDPAPVPNPTPVPAPTLTPEPLPNTTTTAAPAVTSTRLPATVPTTARAAARWAPFPGAVGAVRYDVGLRVVGLDARGRRTYGPWRFAARSTTSSDLTIRGVPGGVYQYVVRGTDARGVVSAWSSAGTALIPLDVTPRTGTRTGRWSMTADRTAFGGGVLTTATRGASLSITSAGTDSISLVVGTSPTGGSADVYVDGRRTARITTYARVASGAKVATGVRVPFGRHTVTVICRTGSLRLDGVAFGR